MASDSVIGAVPVVEMKGITKRFPGVLANDHVDFVLSAGEVHALLGENGAGKTTLMNVLYGLYRADEGEINVRGVRARIASPRDSIGLGISMVHQRFELVDTLTVSENVALGLKARRPPILDLRVVSQRISELSRKYGLEVSPQALIRQLSVGERQRVEIIKALYRGAEILILDEPTSVLTPQESEELFELLRSMAGEGKSIVIITHKLPEVMAVSDRVTVLRKGKLVGTMLTSSTNALELAYKMVGHDVSFGFRGGMENVGSTILELEGVFATNDKGALGLKGLSLSVGGGEILGIAGVAGNGQNELEEVLSGMRKVDKGRVIVRGTEMTNASPRDMIGLGVGVIPEDRTGTGLIMEFSVAENIILELRATEPYSRRAVLDDRQIRSRAQALVEEFSIATPDVSLPAYTLSGGNLQRLILAKVLSRKPSILIAAQPTAGLDVSATQFIWEKLKAERDKGVGILLISSDLNEITALSDRIAVIYDGAIVGTISASEADTNKIGLMMGGSVPA
jgi:simple sugar transport system ATP-binding protein